jgi:lipopolysaccharide/colanic/teichoic acid biosynthesis glycosyltransferase
VGTRNVLIVGTGPEAHALRHHLESIRHLGYTFKGFIDFPGSGPVSRHFRATWWARWTRFSARAQAVCGRDFLYHALRAGIVQDVLEQARVHGVDLRVVPDMYDGLAWNSPIEYIGQFPDHSAARGHVPEIGLLLKRGWTLCFPPLALLFRRCCWHCHRRQAGFARPGLLLSERIGKKGRVFRCIKFRTMVRDAEKRRADVMHMNERDGVLFKIQRSAHHQAGPFSAQVFAGRTAAVLQRLRGDMSIVGPRPPLASEVKEYKLSHLRRLDVMPGITGLWQVQARQDPSFDSYISLDVTYIENWSIWLDLKIMHAHHRRGICRHGLEQLRF